MLVIPIRCWWRRCNGRTWWDFSNVYPSLSRLIIIITMSSALCWHLIRTHRNKIDDTVVYKELEIIDVVINSHSSSDEYRRRRLRDFSFMNVGRKGRRRADGVIAQDADPTVDGRIYFFFFITKTWSNAHIHRSSLSRTERPGLFPPFLIVFFFFSCYLRWWDGPDFQLSARHSRLDTFCPVTGMASFPVESAKFESGRHCFRRQYNKCGKWWNAHTTLKDQTTNDDKDFSYIFYFFYFFFFCWWKMGKKAIPTIHGMNLWYLN